MEYVILVWALFGLALLVEHVLDRRDRTDRPELSDEPDTVQP